MADLKSQLESGSQSKNPAADPARRRFLAWGASAALLTAASATSVVGGKRFSTKAQASGTPRSLVVIPPSGEGHGDTLDHILPGLRSSAVYAPLSGAVMLLKNESPVAVRAVSLAWTFTTSSGTNQVFRTYFARSTRRTVSGALNLARPGQIRAITPFFLHRGGLANVMHKLAGAPKVNETFRFLASEIARAISVSAQVDAVIYADMVIIGPDEARLGHLFRAKRNAEHDECLWLAKQLRAGAKPGDLIAGLTLHKKLENIAGGQVPRSRWKRVAITAPGLYKRGCCLPTSTAPPFARTSPPSGATRARS